MGRRKKPEPLPKHHEAVKAAKSKKVASYRPSPTSATLEEAKEILRKRYEKRGFVVSQVRRFDRFFFTVNFVGKGPMGLEQVLCNWPNIGGAKTEAIVEKKLHKGVEKILEENRRRK